MKGRESLNRRRAVIDQGNVKGNAEYHAHAMTFNRESGPGRELNWKRLVRTSPLTVERMTNDDGHAQYVRSQNSWSEAVQTARVFVRFGNELLLLCMCACV